MGRLRLRRRLSTGNHQAVSRAAASATTPGSPTAAMRACSPVESFLARPPDGGPYRYLWLDALTQRVREEGRIALVSPAGYPRVRGKGRRHGRQRRRQARGAGHRCRHERGRGLGWPSLRGLVARGLSRVELVTSAHRRGRYLPQPRRGDPARRRRARRAARRVGGGEALHDDSGAAVPDWARGHLRRGAAAAAAG